MFDAARFSHADAALRPIAPGDVEELATAVAGMPPWVTIGYPKAAVVNGLTRPDPSATRLAVTSAGSVAGLIILREPWLLGPYVQTLALLPLAQGRGIGGALLAWAEREASPRARWMWLCVSDHNPRARAFYERAGYAAVGALPGLIVDGMDETLMRKRLV